MSQSLTICLVLLFAQTPESWVGKRVITHYGAVLKVKGQVENDADRGKNLRRGKDQQSFRVYKVEQTNGQWLWLVEEGGSARGWITAEWLIPFDQAVDYYTNQIRANPSSVNYLKRGQIWKHKKEYDIAIADYNEAIRLDPQYAGAFINRGLAWSNKKEYDKAIADDNEAIRLDPQYALAFNNRGVAWRNKKEYDKAIADYNEAIRLDPQSALAFNNRGYAWHNKKEYDKAIADYNEAIRLDPQSAEAYNSKAWLMATCPEAKYRDGKRAVESATRACELSDGKEPNYFGTLAAAYAESGDFDKAVESQTKAIELLKDEKDKEDFQSRLDLYKARKPYRTPQ